MSNGIYSWNMDNMDSGALITADGKMVPMPLVNELGRLGNVEQLTEKEIMDLLDEKREQDRQAEFERLNVDVHAVIPVARTSPTPVEESPPGMYFAPREVCEDSGGYLVGTVGHSQPKKPKPSAMSNDEIWDELIDLQDTLRKYYLELGGRRIKGAGKWLMSNVQYINTSQMEGIAIRNGFALDEVPAQDFVSEN